MPCTQCPRRCPGRPGFCGGGMEIVVSKVMLHPWEEPCFGGKAGAVFFAGCSLGCVYCQNKEISQGRPLKGRRLDAAGLAGILRELAGQGATCIDLVTPTHFARAVLDAVATVKAELPIPVVWNTGGYEAPEVIREAEGLVDVFLTDFKYGTAETAARYSRAGDYPAVAAAALTEMHRVAGPPVWDGDRLVRGVVLRHLILPGSRKDSITALRLAAEAAPPTEILLSLMRQYTPDFAPPDYPELRRRLTTFEYESVRTEALRLGYDGFGQDAASADARFTPEW